MGGGLIILLLLVIRAHGPPPGGNSSNSTQPVVDGMGACGGTAWWWQANAAVPLAVGSKFKSDDDLDTQPILHPPWGFLVPQHGHVCTDASTSHAPHQQNNTRNSFWALPSGPPPEGGFPVYVELKAEIFFAGDWQHPDKDPPLCGNGWVPPPDGWWRPKFNVFDTPARAMASCFRPDGRCNPTKLRLSSTPRRTYMYNPCTEHTHCKLMGRAGCVGIPSWEPLGWHAGANCSFFQKAGQLWVARMHQYLLANGIAVLLVNPYAGDTWEWDTPQLPDGSGLDQPFLKELFGSINNGSYGGLPVGTLNTQQTIFSGFSDGAQMTSWLVELRARKALPPGVEMIAGVFLSGGSHRCYMSPPDAVSNCADCTDTKGNCGGGSGSRGCSLTASPLCCSYCCPANFTEDYYHTHPAEMKDHPPCFLAQSAASDFNADLCASRVYYDTLQGAGVLSQLVLLPKEEALCACVGSPSERSPEGRASPLARECALKPPEPLGDRGNCVDHVAGFAAMVVPLTEFLLKVLAGVRTNI
jgi:hypothetical protein